ncbi:hypothetical protein GE21DRAFT_9721 [Neurospora crassa]|uniref:Fungal N-terminal domain-containing protein n=1 Tax=Neurospora crassa (strain ATCC 24698 / 74-OR23-1A / CBS 708.71 / DSM 1257 / FGSC 987) TaxID=367110 RepID=Q7S2U4_NEUCR|nr:hypothetical protein NCU09031 [Neurospora crassa OR74A]EAA29742.1 hypothetical protein NCU09031 [Neurospora crassa OR74A]KHE86157.1 hypothetical protein GE21DRAFT_9721 [Neurospora crassa]|eukprot:XP_958978.1 hypothetical protein NCU09031 [Neurospora crassa OR74A]
MDPASILGIVAAACQFAELAAKGAIKGAGLLKSLRDTPAKLTELLTLVQISKQNMVQLRDHLAHPTLLSLSSQFQLQTYRDDIGKAHKVAQDLELQIESLVGPTTQDLRGIKKLWRDVITIKKEGEFNDRFEAIQRYNEQIHRGLSGLQVALSTKNLESSVAIGTRVNENTTVLAEIKDKVYELNSRKTDVDIDVNVHGSTLIGAQQTRASPATTRIELELRLEPATIRDELRSELMLLMTGQGLYASASNALLPIVSRLSHEDRAQVASMLLMNQIPYSNNPRRHSNSAAARRSFDRHSASGPTVCGCDTKTYNTGKAFRRGPFSFGYGYENQKRHHTSCPYSGGQAVKQTWNYQLCMQLLPLVNKTVQFAFSATIGGGGFELRFPLKVFPTVQRANSAIFRLFDNFAERCAELDFFREYYVDERLYPWFCVRRICPTNNGHDSNTAVVWNIDRIRQELRHIHRVLCDAHILQIGSIRDRDESGYTVLHEMMLLILILMPVSTCTHLAIFHPHRTMNATVASPLNSAIAAIQMSLPLFGQMLDSIEQPHLPFDIMLSTMSLHWDSRTIKLAADMNFYDVEFTYEFDFDDLSGEVNQLMMDLVKADAMDWAQIVVKSHVRKRTDLATLGRQHLSPIDQKRLGLSTTQVIPLDAHARELYNLLRDQGIQVPQALHPGWAGSIYQVLGDFSDNHYGSPRIYKGSSKAPSTAQVRESFLLVVVAQQLFDNGFTAIDDGFTVFDKTHMNIRRDKLKGASPNFPLPIHHKKQGYLGRRRQSSRNLLERLAKGCTTQPNSHWSLMRLLVQYVSGLCPPMLTDSCVCYCLASDGCLPQHLHVSFDAYSRICNQHEHKANALVSWLESCSLTRDEKSLCFEQAVRLELFDRLGLVHTCCLGREYKMNPPKPEEVERIRDDDEELASHLKLLMFAYRGSLLMFLQRHDEDEEYSTEFDCGCYEFEDLGKTPPSWGSHNLDGHTTRLLAHWRHWWSVTDPILADIYGITRMELYKAYGEEVFNVRCRSEVEVADMMRETADRRTNLNLEEMGFGDLDYKEVIERHFATELTYAKENIISVPRGSEDAHYWLKKFDETAFVPVYRTELLDELMEKLRRAVSGQDEIFAKETDIWSDARSYYEWTL